MRKFLDEAEPEGVIYVSFGSALKASFMSDQTRKTFFKVFGKLKQKVLWKWETGNVEETPKNVMLHKWLPQQDVLGHQYHCKKTKYSEHVFLSEIQFFRMYQLIINLNFV